MKIEKGLAIAILVGLLFKLFHWPGGGIILVISLMTMALLYCPGGFYLFRNNAIRGSNLVFSIIAGFFLSIIPIAVLFKLQYWPGSSFYLLFGIVTAPIILAITLFLKSKSPDHSKTYYKNMTIRTATWTILLVLLHFTPTETLLKVEYWSDPELARLKTLYYTNPENEEYKRQHDEYLQRRDSISFQEMEYKE